MLLALLRLGLSYGAARRIGMEEALCLLHHGTLDEELRRIDAEAARVASLSLADEDEQRRALTVLQHRAAAAVDRFYRRY